jgi:hypothetical protein
MTNLSPNAQAVMTAWGNVIKADNYGGRVEAPIAAALRAAADQVVPEEPLYGGDQRWMFERDARQASRKKFFTIADELEGVKYGTYRCNLKEK